MSAVLLIATDILQVYTCMYFIICFPGSIGGAPRNNIYQLRTLENAMKPRKNRIKTIFCHVYKAIVNQLVIEIYLTCN